jgi:peptidoglycan hydrolase-like protein with peptidoglycan-binding domain
MRSQAGGRPFGTGRPGGPRGPRPHGVPPPGMTPPIPRPAGFPRRRRHYPYWYPRYRPYVIGQPVEVPFDAPSVGRFGNWLRSGNDVILLLDEDATPLDQDAAAASPQGAAAAPSNGAASTPPPDAGAAPSEGAAATPPEGGGDAPPPAGAADAPASGTEGELSGRGGLSRRKLSRIQQSLNYLKGLRLPVHGLSNPQTRSALRSYQQQKGLVPNGQADTATEMELAYDVAESRANEAEFAIGTGYGPGFGTDKACFRRCEFARQTCSVFSKDRDKCLKEFIECAERCNCQPRPTLRIGSGGYQVVFLQTRLNASRATPRVVVDGLFGPKTDAAVRAFQRRFGLVVDGIVGPKTWTELAC